MTWDDPASWATKEQKRQAFVWLATKALPQDNLETEESFHAGVLMWGIKRLLDLESAHEGADEALT